MPNLQHPETGGHILAQDPETVEELLADGWELIVDGPVDDAAPAEEAPPAPPPPPPPAGAGTPPGGDGSTPPAVEPEKPLDKLKLTELIEHGEKIGMTVEQLQPLRKAGASKAQAIEAINAHVAALASA